LFDLTIAENITYGLENVPIESIIDAATNANIHQFIEQLPQVTLDKITLNICFNCM
jgi:ABC-type multidrug transport system fused ATPase/permease subunit